MIFVWSRVGIFDKKEMRKKRKIRKITLYAYAVIEKKNNSAIFIKNHPQK